MRILQQLLSMMGINTKGLPNIALQDAMSRDRNIAAGLMGDLQPGMQQMQNQQNPAGGNMPPSVGSEVTRYLDGRSQGAIDTINSMNNLAGV